MNNIQKILKAIRKINDADVSDSELNNKGGEE